jgi:uncharacterized protein YdhG (YjbR/CyaY superfamily)
MAIDDAAQRYIDAIAPAHRALFDRIHGLILAEHPEAEVVVSYGIPTYKANGQRLYVGAWQHGVSLYGWHDGHDGGFVERHPSLVSGRATLRLGSQDAATIDDDELRGLVRAALQATS